MFKEKLKSHFKKLPAPVFGVGLVLLMIALDFANGVYLHAYWEHQSISLKMVEASLAKGQLSPSEVSPESFNEMQLFVTKMFGIFLLIILANNLFFYSFYLKRKAWAHHFVQFYCLTAVLFSLLFIKDSFAMGILWGLFNLLCILVYSYFYLGLKYLKDEILMPTSQKKE